MLWVASWNCSSACTYQVPAITSTASSPGQKSVIFASSRSARMAGEKAKRTSGASWRHTRRTSRKLGLKSSDRRPPAVVQPIVQVAALGFDPIAVLQLLLRELAVIHHTEQQQVIDVRQPHRRPPLTPPRSPCPVTCPRHSSCAPLSSQEIPT